MSESFRMLKKYVKPNDMVYTILRHCSASGMSRAIDVYVIRKNEPKCFSWAVADVLDYKMDKKHEGIKVSGCGMDMGYHLVYSLGRVLFPNGDGKTVTGRNGDTKPETDGGYLLKQRWI